MNDLVVIDTPRGPVELSTEIVRKYFCPGASDQEIGVFLKLCEYQKLNPFLREAYLVKYGSQPATMVVGWHVFLQRAESNPNFNGYEVEVYDQADAPYRGRQGQTISHATAKVYRKDRKHPVIVTVLFKEYCVTNAQGHPAASWAKIPTTMIRKVALEQALRETFTREFQGVYGPEEMGVTEELPEEEVLPTAPTVAPDGGIVFEAAVDEAPEPPDEPTDHAAERLKTFTDARGITPPRMKRPAVITPLTAAKYLTELHGVAWMREKVEGLLAGEYYFGVPVKTVSELAVLASTNKPAWDAGITKLLVNAEAQRDRAK